MNHKIYNYIFLFIILYFNYISSKKIKEIHSIISATLNGTAAYVSLESIDQNEKYIYFTFDFKYHHSAVKKYNNLAKFYLNSDFALKGLKKEKMQYGFVEKKWDEIKTDNDIKNIKWKTIKFVHHEEKSEKNFDYYFKIKRRKGSMNTLLLRIPVNGRAEGSINIENILDFPEFDKIDWDSIEGIDL